MHESRNSQLNFFANTAAMCTTLLLLAFFLLHKSQDSKFPQWGINLKVLSRRGQLSAEGQSGRLALHTYVGKSNHVWALTLGGGEFRRELAMAGRFQFPKVWARCISASIARSDILSRQKQRARVGCSRVQRWWWDYGVTALYDDSAHGRNLFLKELVRMHWTISFFYELSRQKGSAKLCSRAAENFIMHQ